MNHHDQDRTEPHRRGPSPALRIGASQDIFGEIQRRLAPLSSHAYFAHQGALYGNPNLLAAARDVPRWLIAPERHSGYNGERELRARIAERFLGDAAESESVVLCNGATNGLSLAIGAAVRPGANRVHAFSPYWLYLQGVVAHAGAVLDEIPTLRGRELFPEADLLGRLADRLAADSACVYVANPANPVGNLASPEFVEALISLCSDRDAWLVVDHAYYGFDEASARGNPLERLPRVFRHPRVVNVFTFSKLFGVPGVRLGFVHAHPSAASRLAERYRYTSYTPNSFSQSVVHHYLGDDALLRERRRRYAENLRIVRAVDLPCVRPSGGFFAFVQAGPAHLSRLLDVGIGLVAGALFGDGYDTHARFCFTAEPPDRLAACCALLARELDRDEEAVR